MSKHVKKNLLWLHNRIGPMYHSRKKRQNTTNEDFLPLRELDSDLDKVHIDELKEGHALWHCPAWRRNGLKIPLWLWWVGSTHVVQSQERNVRMLLVRAWMGPLCGSVPEDTVSRQNKTTLLPPSIDLSLLLLWLLHRLWFFWYYPRYTKGQKHNGRGKKNVFLCICNDQIYHVWIWEMLQRLAVKATWKKNPRRYR